MLGADGLFLREFLAGLSDISDVNTVDFSSPACRLCKRTRE